MATVAVQKEEVVEKPVSEDRVTIILSKGSLDMVYPAFMIANTAASMGSEVHVFCTFWGLSALNKKKYASLKVSPVGNPGMPMPNIIGMIPGMTAIATRMMKGKIRETRTPSIPEMIQQAHQLGVHIHACSTSMEFTGVTKEDLIPEVEDIIGAATMLGFSEGARTFFI